MAKPLFGLLADFADADALLAATRAAHQAGYRHMEAFSPFPLEAIEPLLGLDHREPIRWGVAGALFGALAGFGLQIYVNLDYPLDIGGRPLVALQAFAVVGFLLMILFAGLFAVFGLLLACRLPLLHHPLFEAESFRRASDDRFLLCIYAEDPLFDPGTTLLWLSQRAVSVTEIEP
ncbi:DUF3341 domain-containing protein [Pseudomonas sp. S5(2021)]|jgi:hypothetical protein|uniref:DUF3341 domain-containing protein n=1 Tax=Stutzerimonas balearica TaxID=74829 RepID=UPI0007737205|nr:DUF3341 domain-containing protein [Stutzerimonas balearica]MBB62370.1 DUF3341 domain-containing protein [Pseudomonas sp.]MBZ5756962.1 DUF3341 domain-containing protein [Pseudomonas sp. S5(2021)]WIX01672.1 DUF3341 domain-containing protein [Pseudomonas sp. AR5]MBD3736778.1 DUF3341 domain-containing protein [Stutzerimonas balearica]OMG64327.1 hypothetical protein AUR61_010700 [Stutzerimonas balearica]